MDRPSSSQRRAWLTDLIVQIWNESRQTYGARRVRAELADAHDQNVNLKMVRSIMREQGIAGLPARRRYKRSDANRHTSSDLVNRAFDRDGPNQLWMTDITEHPTTEGKVYCCAVLDAWSRRIVGWSVDRRATSAMVNAALGMAVEQRGQGALIHTDHGPQAGFKWSSQHPVVEVLCGSSSASSRSGGAAEVEVARSSEVSASCRGSVLG